MKSHSLSNSSSDGGDKKGDSSWCGASEAAKGTRISIVSSDLPWFPRLCIESVERRLHVGVPQNTTGYHVLIEHGSVANAQLIFIVLSRWFWF